VSRSESFSRRHIAASLLVAAVVPLGQVPRESASCESNIVSSTVVATFCSHRLDRDEILDLLILWRGHPGWFQRRDGGSGGRGGSRQFGAGTKGHVLQHSTYGDVTISFDADFDANVVTIGEERVPLNGVNTVMVDHIDEPAARRVSATRWSEPRLPLIGDRNLILVQRSRELLDYLQCQIPMPTSPSMRTAQLQVAVISVCEKLTPK
jgi:hypothetical protein